MVKGSVMPSRPERAADQPGAPERHQQGDAGHGRRQDEGEVDQHLDRALPWEAAGRQDVRQGEPEGHHGEGRGRARDQAQPERVEDERIAEPMPELRCRDAEHERHERKPEQQQQGARSRGDRHGKHGLRQLHRWRTARICPLRSITPAPRPFRSSLRWT